jgi:hypothetical protein
LNVERHFAAFCGKTCAELGKAVPKMSRRLSQFPLDR